MTVACAADQGTGHDAALSDARTRPRLDGADDLLGRCQRARCSPRPAAGCRHCPARARLSAGYELMYRIGKDYEKPEFGIHSHRRRRPRIPGGRTRGAGQAVLPPAALQALRRRRRQHRRLQGRPAGAGGRAAVGPPRHAAARHRARRCCATTRSTSPTGSTRAWCRPTQARSTSTTTSPTSRSSSAHIGAERPARDQRLPADRAGAGRGVADGRARRSRRRVRW